MKIAVLTRNFSGVGGGAERYSVSLVEQLAARHEIHVYAQGFAHQWPGITYHLVSSPLKKPRWLNQIWFAVATWWHTRRGYDVVHSHENTWHGNVQTVHVLPVRYNLFHEHRGLNRLLRWIKVATSPRLLTYLVLERARYATQAGRCIVVTSKSLREIMRATYPACESMVSVVTPGVTMPLRPVTAERRCVAREGLGLPQNKYLLLFVANDFRKKGLTALLEALARLPPHVGLVVVGNSAKIAAFDSQVAALDLADRVYFLGPLHDMEPAYEGADALVHPTLEDTFGMVVLEAMSYGLPVVVSAERHCGISGLLTHGENVMILNDPTDVSAIVNTLVKIVESEPLRQHLSQRASSFAASYAWGAIGNQQEAIYLSVIANVKNVASKPA